MQGVASPYLILDGNTTPHSFTLKPSGARALQNAQLVFWTGNNLEVFLKKPLASLASKAQIVALSKTEGLQHWPLRDGEKWKTEPEHDHSSMGIKKQEHDDHEDHQDPHVWLDPLNAKIMLINIVQTLVQLDPKHALQYQGNAEKMAIQLDLLHLTLVSDMKNISEYPYMVFHDSYQYFEKRYRLNPVGSIVFQSEQMASAKHLRKVRQLIKDNRVLCVFSEPQFSPRKVKTVIQGTDVKTGLLDPLGADLSPGPELYNTLILNLAQSLKSCLEDQLKN